MNSQEHLLIIYLNMNLSSGWLLREQFVWDLSNPDNSPEDFARKLMFDYRQPQVGEDLNRVVFEIRRQIDSHCARLALNFKRNAEAICESENEN